MLRTKILGFLFGCQIAMASGQVFVDMHTHSTQRALKSMRQRPKSNIWTRAENDCGTELPLEVQNYYRNHPKYSQAPLEALLRAGVRVSNQQLSPTEGQFLRSNALGEQPMEVLGCVRGEYHSAAEILGQNIDYFQKTIKQIQYLYKEQIYPFYRNGISYRFRILRSGADLDTVLRNPQQLGLVLSVWGGHALGDFMYARSGLTHVKEFETLVLNNTDKLKGVLPLTEGGNDYLEISPFSMGFANFYPDGICGKVRQLDENGTLLFGEQTELGEGFSPLGQRVVRRLLSRESGRRVLVDASGIPLVARQWLYDLVQEARYEKDSIPILASNSSISGLAWRDKEYGLESGLSPKRKRPRAHDYFNNHEGSLAKEDLKRIHDSEGLVGISLAKHKLLGPRYLRMYDETLPQSEERRKLITQAVAASVCRVIFAVQEKTAWDMIAIGSGFDTHEEPLEMCATPRDLEHLRRELIGFFKHPTDIEGLYTAAQIRKFLYGMSAEEVVDKIMSENALRFLRKQLDQNQQSKSIREAAKNE